MRALSQLQDQLKSITDSASFSGENWLKGVIGKAAATAGDLATGVTINKQIVGSFTRNSEGNVKVQSIDVALDGSNVLVDISGNKQGILDSNALRADVAKWTDDKFYTATTTLANTFSEGANGVWSDGTDFYKQVGDEARSHPCHALEGKYEGRLVRSRWRRHVSTRPRGKGNQ